MRALLDVNVLAALLDRQHAAHAAAHGWLSRNLVSGWASCPITENGCLRVMTNPRYPAPVAPTGWPLASNPPEGLMGMRPERLVAPLSSSAAPDSETTRRVLATIDRYAETSPEMTMFGQLILDTLPAVGTRMLQETLALRHFLGTGVGNRSA